MPPEDRIIELEEALAYAQQARDNAITLREEVQARAKEQRKNIGRMISEMRDLVKVLCQEVDENTRRWADDRMNEILNKKGGSDDSRQADL